MMISREFYLHWLRPRTSITVPHHIVYLYVILGGDLQSDLVPSVEEKVFAIRQAAARSSLSLLSPAISTVDSASAADKKFYILGYKYVDNIFERRAPFRSKHLEHALNAKKNGDLVMGGALANPPDAAVINFTAADKQTVEDFAEKDPYVINDLVTSFSIREWTVVV
ncbi:unnamed protein product [Phytophthora fragariaefolia]|uniref:Unnamed protein product n=1 Tax=Phytophthora fragariaefolia TaxID=1490495 RepID=A0A9W7CZV3_9STRA|nr:unnamed protein product [Phytophthora fragariaefolia]